MTIKRIELPPIGVKEALNDKTSIETDVYNEVIIKKEVIPIILVPGIMGSRNENSAGKVIWDPDRLSFLISFARKNKEKRKELLIGESGFNSDYMQVIEKGRDPWWRTKLTTDEQDQRGWGGVMFGAYGNLLKKLEEKNQMGNTGDKVACLMIHMPGGLQLLPTNDFTALAGKWLHVYVNGEKQNSYPIHDVYKDIYQGQEYYHLLDQRNFSESSDSDEVSNRQGNYNVWNDYLKYIKQAAQFHKKIGKNVLHEHTVQVSSTNVKTTMELEYEVVTEFEELTIYVNPSRGATRFLPKYSFFIRHKEPYGFVYAVPKKFSRDNADIDKQKGTRKEIENWWETDKQGQPVRHIKLFEYIKRDGDGTVVRASQEALPLDSSNELFTHLQFNGLEHQNMAGNRDVIRSVVRGVENFLRLYLQEIQN